MGETNGTGKVYRVGGSRGKPDTANRGMYGLGPGYEEEVYQGVWMRWRVRARPGRLELYYRLSSIDIESSRQSPPHTTQKPQSKVTRSDCVTQKVLATEQHHSFEVKLLPFFMFRIF